nr:tyrosine-type recombinase/integrase [Siminovitchia terrae]
MARLLKIAGLNGQLTPHSLRHTHTSLLAEAGVGLEQIMDRLGHTDDHTTKNVYLHVTKEMKKEASQKFTELMRSLLSCQKNVSMTLIFCSKPLMYMGFRDILHHARHVSKTFMTLYKIILGLSNGDFCF